MIVLQRIFILLVFISFPAFCFGQATSSFDSISSNNTRHQTSLLQQMILPVALTGSAVLMSNSKLEQELQPKLNRNLSTNIDDYTRYVPLAGMYIADVMGVKAENHWFDQTKNAAISMILTQFITKQMKANIDKERPDGTDFRAFPSGHTSIAFASATVLYEEFKDTSPILAYSGYAFATATGYLRVAKNKHWVSDIVMGSALGIAVTKLVYHFDYLFAWNPFKQSEKLLITPKLDAEGAGVGLVFLF